MIYVETILVSMAMEAAAEHTALEGDWCVFAEMSANQSTPIFFFFFFSRHFFSLSFQTGLFDVLCRLVLKDTSF